MTFQEQAHDAFTAHYGEAPTVTVTAPARVNLIGGHTDYNGGYTLLTNVNRLTAVTLRPREDGVVNLYDRTTDTAVTFQLSQFDKPTDPLAAYLTGAAWALGEQGFALRGWDGVLDSEAPATLDLAQDVARLLVFIRAFAHISGVPCDTKDIVRVADNVQRDWMGRRSCYADALCMASLDEGQALLVDMHTRAHEQLPLPSSVGLLMLEVPQSVDVGAIETTIVERQADCQAAAETYRVSHLRDLSMSRFEKDVDSMENIIFNYARHVLTENGRVILAGEMLRSEALATVGRLMLDSHQSLNTEYGLHHEPFDALMDCVQAQQNVYGARWSGHGNGVIVLTRDFSAETLGKLVQLCYKKASGEELTTHHFGRVGPSDVV